MTTGRGAAIRLVSAAAPFLSPTPRPGAPLAITRTPGGTVIFTGADVERYRLITIKSALRLEAAGMRRRGPSALALAREVSGLKARTAAEMLPQFVAWLDQRLAAAEPSEEFWEWSRKVVTARAAAVALVHC